MNSSADIDFEEEDEVENDIEFVSRMQSGRIRATSKRAYNSSQNLMAKFIQEKHPSYWDESGETGEIVLPLPTQVVLEMFGSLARKRDGTLKTHPTIQGYKSSLKNLYRDREIEFDASLEIKLSDFSSGYKRNVADLKEQGKMKLAEGKTHLTFERYRYSIVFNLI
jgi:hypothetical protein